VIVGLSAVIYALSYGALLFSGSLSIFVGYGISIALVTAAFGAVLGLLSKEKTFVGGPYSNTISVLAAILVPLGALGLSPDGALALALVTICGTAVLTAAAFYGVARADLADFFRYIPFPVMAGFLAATGWLMTSGALNIIAELPLSRIGWARFIADPCGLSCMQGWASQRFCSCWRRVYRGRC
jgi:SulP family sulfate permease